MLGYKEEKLLLFQFHWLINTQLNLFQIIQDCQLAQEPNVMTLHKCITNLYNLHKHIFEL